MLPAPRLITFLLLVALCWGCGGKRLNPRVTLWRNDKIPYGLKYARETLPYLFPNGRIINSEKSPVDLNDDLPDSLDGKAAILIVSEKMIPDEEEIRQLMDFIANGNHVFISSYVIGKDFLDSLRLDTKFHVARGLEDSLTVSINLQGTDSVLSYTYPGAGLKNYFTKYDTSITWIRGQNDSKEPNLVEFDYKGGGSLVIQLEPLAYSNFFLLHKNNAPYLGETVGFLPDTLSRVYWSDYYRYHTNGKKNDRNNPNTFSKLGVFMKDPILRWVVILVFILFGFVYLFESRRRQRVRPQPVVVANPSVDFVKTVGSLYFQARDNKDLAIKMSNQFMEHVRSRYLLNVSVQDEQFAVKLANKSGYDIAKVQQILNTIRDLNAADNVSDELLLAFDQTLADFYKQG